MTPHICRLVPTRIVAALFLAGLLLSPAVAAPLPPAAGGPPAPELAGTGAARLEVVPPDALLRRLAPESSSAFLVEGTRPPDDRPFAETKVLGRRGAPDDWLLVERGFGHGAVWVTGLQAPPAGEPVAITGRLETEGGAIRALSGIRLLVDGDRGKETAVPPGDFVRYTLPGGMPGREPGLMVRRLPIESTRVEIEGDAAAQAFTDGSNVVVVRAVKPGVAKVRFFAHVSGEKSPRPMGEHAIRVTEAQPAR